MTGLGRTKQWTQQLPPYEQWKRFTVDNVDSVKSGLKKIDNSLTSKKARLSKNPGLSVEIANDIKNKEKYTSEITELESTLKKLQALRGR